MIGNAKKNIVGCTSGSFLAMTNKKRISKIKRIVMANSIKLNPIIF